MSLTAYFDETGHSRDPKVSFAGMAGMVASVDAWKVLEKDWAILLDAENVRELHMKELAHFKGGFKGWDEGRRRRFLGRVIDIIFATKGMPVGAAVDLRAYRQLDARVQERLRDPYYMCLNVCVHGAIVYGLFDEREWMEGRPFVYTNEKVNLVFDQNNEMAKLVPSFMAAMEKRPLYNKQIGDYTFSSSEKQMPLQAADFIAYEMGRTCKNLIAGRPPAFSWGLQKIFQLSAMHELAPWFSVYNEDTLKRIERGMLDQIARGDDERLGEA